MKKNYFMVKAVFILAATVLPLLLGSCSKKNVQSDAPDSETALQSYAGSSVTANGIKIDFDFTALNATMVYSEVFNMLVEPAHYNGKKIRVRGTFSSFIPNGKTERAYMVVVSDEHACCQQGIEFKLSGGCSYPKDYPPLDSEIEIIGTFILTQTEEGYDYFYIACDEITEL